MAVIRRKKTGKINLDLTLSNLYDLAKKVLCEPSYTWLVAIVLCLSEVAVNLLVIWKVKCK